MMFISTTQIICGIEIILNLFLAKTYDNENSATSLHRFQSSWRWSQAN